MGETEFYNCELILLGWLIGDLDPLRDPIPVLWDLGPFKGSMIGSESLRGLGSAPSPLGDSDPLGDPMSVGSPRGLGIGTESVGEPDPVGINML